jgi:RNA polymerase sigma-70 factor, ECF subfamily
MKKPCCRRGGPPTRSQTRAGIHATLFRSHSSIDDGQRTASWQLLFYSSSFVEKVMSRSENTEDLSPSDRPSESEAWIVDRVRTGDQHAWQVFIGKFEGRLLSYVEQRLSDRSHAEDIVQETFIGFLNSLPNYDGRRSLENYLFSICSYKLTDHLRRISRRPTRSLDISTGSGTLGNRIPGHERVASSIARSDEKREKEQRAIVNALREQIDKWRNQQDWLKLTCLELVIVAGRPNCEVAELLKISEQKVANYKSDFIARTKQQLAKSNVQLDAMLE